MNNKEIPKNLSADIEQVCQAVLDLPKLQKYFHVQERPERKPVRVVRSPQMPENIRLVKFGEPVTLVRKSDANADSKPYFEFTRIEVGDDSAHLEFLYPVEGVAGTAVFRKSSGGWVHVQDELKER